jgi:hypothetical protein
VMARVGLLKRFFPSLVGSLGKENRIFSRWASNNTLINNTLIQDVDPAFFVDPYEQDILLTDIREVNLQHEIAKEFNVGFLSLVTKDDISWPIKGFLYGPHSRPVVNLIFGRKEKLVNVFCIVDTGSPYTYISLATIHALGVEDSFDSSVKAVIHGLPMSAYMSPCDKHFPDINLIGSDFLRRANALLSYDFSKDLVELVSVP